jgi:hypothetical protein
VTPPPPIDAAPPTPEGAAAPYTLAPVEGAATVAGVVTAARRRRAPAGVTACGAPAEPAMSVDVAGGVEGALVWIDAVRGKPPAEPGVVDAALTSCRFDPRLAMVPRIGGELAVRNDDPIRHEVAVEWLGLDGQGQPESVAAIPMPLEGASFVLPMPRAGLVRLSCALHPSETGWAMVPPHPYHAVTGSDGRFTIDDVPPGRYRLLAWHPGANGAPVRAETTIEVTAEATAEVTLALPAP